MHRTFDPRFLNLLKQQRKAIALGLTCAFFVGLIELATIGFIKYTVEAIQAADTRLLGIICLSVVGLFGLKYWFTRGQTLYLTLAAHRLTANLRKQLFAKLQTLPIAFFNNRRTGEIQSVITNDVSVIQAGVPLVRDMVTSPVQAFGGLAALFLLNWKLALVSIVAVPPVALAILLNSRKVRSAQKQVQEKLSDMTATMQESLEATRLVRAFTAEERESERFNQSVEATFSSNMRVVRRIASLKPLIELIGAGAIAAVMWFGGLLVASHQMGVGDLMAFVFALDRINRGATGIGGISNVYSQVLGATDRVYQEVLDVQSDIREDPDATTLPAPKGHIRFENVSFAYPDGTIALRSVSFDLRPGECVALVGSSGAGKTTIADLILRFYDATEGRITFDGVDIKKLQTSWLRSQFGVVPQQTFLFAATIRENIAFGKPDATDEEIRQAACLAHADGFIREMPDGYDTVLGERGIRLSGGEMQRIAIARALLVDPCVLLLDEATSSLDAVSERIVQEALEEIMRERTTLLIAHRLTTAARADKIIVLSRGRVDEMGSHQQLMAAGGTYAGMYRAFSSGVFDGLLD